MAASLPSCAVKLFFFPFCLTIADTTLNPQLKCFTAAIAKSSCDPTDTACTCQDDIFQAQVNACVEASCTVPDLLSMASD